MPAPNPTAQLKPGDKVRLTSGGAVMAVERVDRRVEHPYAQCAWMDARRRMQKAFVKLDALELLPPGETPP